MRQIQIVALALLASSAAQAQGIPMGGDVVFCIEQVKGKCTTASELIDRLRAQIDRIAPPHPIDTTHLPACPVVDGNIVAGQGCSLVKVLREMIPHPACTYVQCDAQGVPLNPLRFNDEQARRLWPQGKPEPRP